MIYTALLKPHANSRYQAEALKLAASELTLLLEKGGYQAGVHPQTATGADWLTFEGPRLDEKQAALLGRAAHLYLLFEGALNGALTPLQGRAVAYLGDDLPAVLKYKGKTNEIFTDYLINQALCASDFAPDDALTLADPMCGRGTTLFAAVNRGYHAVGADRDATAIDEAEKYFKRYLEYHKIKHAVSEKSLTQNGRQAARLHVFEFADTAERFKAGDKRTLSLAALDGARLNAARKKESVHLIVSDLSYGVQHAPGGKKGVSLEEMLYDVLPVWTRTLKRGGAMALSFNVNTLAPDMVRGMMAECGLDVMDEPAYCGLEHWVEQAITRDVAVAVKRYSDD